jgi:arsenate reductase
LIDKNSNNKKSRFTKAGKRLCHQLLSPDLTFLRRSFLASGNSIQLFHVAIAMPAYPLDLSGISLHNRATALSRGTVNRGKQIFMKKIYTIGHCTTSLALFEETGLDKLIGPKFTLQNIKFEKITPEQLDEMKNMAGSYEALFSRRAIKYKEWKLKDKKLSEKDYRRYILDEYTFLKRPVIIWDDKIFVGSDKKTVEAIKRELQ